MTKEMGRITWALGSDVRIKVRNIAKQTPLTQEEVADALLRFACDNFKDAKTEIEKSIRAKEAEKKRLERANATVSKLSVDLQEKLADVDQEELAELLKKMGK